MSSIRVLVGTRKGGFVLTSDGKRKRWDVSGPHFAGWEIYHLKGSPADPNRLYASQSSGWFGQVIQRSDDGGKTWEPVGNKFAYDGVAGHPSVVRRHAAPVGVQARLAPRALADRSGHRLRRRRGRGALPLDRRRQDLARAPRACAATARDRAGSRAPAACACTRSSSTRAIPSGSSSPSRLRARSARDDGGTTWQPINRGLHSEHIPDPTAEVGHCVHRIAMHPSRPDVLFMQKHWDVMRSDDAGDSWHEVSGNLPTDFGFLIDVHAHEPETDLRRPDQERLGALSAEGKLRVYRSRTRRQRVGSRSPTASRSATATSTCFGTRWPSTRSTPAASTSARPAARFTPRPMPATTGRRSSAICRPCSPSRCRRCHDPRRAAGASADAGATSKARCSSTSTGRSTQRSVLDALEARYPMLRGTIRDHATQRAPAVRPVLRLRGGPLARVARRPAARSRRERRRAVLVVGAMAGG